jgi:indoleamine 2,3-dioxygenase
LRNYRPFAHQDYVNGLARQSKEFDVKGYAMADSYSSFLYLKAMHNTFGFRAMHWSMVKKYIIDNIKYAKATGGTPITTWLPNQMGACLEQCQAIMKKVKPDELPAEVREEFKHTSETIELQI